MKKKSLQLACSLALAVSMVTQAIYPSAALIADTIETDPDVEISSESSYETSETSEESYPVDVSEPSASTDYTYVEETADLDETEANDLQPTQILQQKLLMRLLSRHRKQKKRKRLLKKRSQQLRSLKHPIWMLSLMK